MNLQTFINILRSRLEDLLLEKAYIDKTCSETESKLSSLSHDELEKTISEEYLNSIIDLAKERMERIRLEDRLLEESVANILSGPRDYSLSDTDPNDEDIEIRSKIQISIKTAPEKDTVYADDSDKQVKSTIFETRLPDNKNLAATKANTVAFATQINNQKNRASRTNFETHVSPQRQKNEHPSNGTSKSDRAESNYTPKKINEKDLYNSSPDLIFTLLLIFFSPTIIFLLAVSTLIMLIILTLFSTTMIIVILALAFVFIVGGALSTLTAAYSLSSLFLGNIGIAIGEIGIFLIVFSVTMLLSSLITRLARRILPKLSHSIVRFCTFMISAPKEFFLKCKRGCATL